MKKLLLSFILLDIASTVVVVVVFDGIGNDHRFMDKLSGRSVKR